MLTLIKAKYELYPYNSNTYCVLVKTKYLANKLNKYLNYYKDYSFQEGEEPIFKFSPEKLQSVLDVLGVDPSYINAKND